MQRVFVLDNQKQPLMPCHPARARQLLDRGKAAVFRRVPFTLILKERTGGDVQPVEARVDPGSRTTGLALVARYPRGDQVVWAANLSHRGQTIKRNLDSRRAIRRGAVAARPATAPRAFSTAPGRRVGCLLPCNRGWTMRRPGRGACNACAR